MATANKGVLQEVYSSPKSALFYTDDLLVNTLNWTRVGSNPGSWPATPASLGNGSYAVWRNPASAQTRFEVMMALTIGSPADYALIIISPLISASSGWNGSNFGTNPATSGVTLRLPPGSERFTAIANDNRFYLWAEWQCAAVTGSSDMDFDETGGVSTITRGSGDFYADGWVKGMTFVVSSTSNNNGAKTVKSVDSATQITTEETLTDEVGTSGVLTPDLCNKLAFAGRISPFESADNDAQPCVAWSNNFNHAGISSGWNRIYAGDDTTELTAGFVVFPCHYSNSALNPYLAAQATGSGNWAQWTCELHFNESSKRENPGVVDGMFLHQASTTKELWGESGTWMTLNGVGIPWIAGESVIQAL